VDMHVQRFKFLNRRRPDRAIRVQQCTYIRHQLLRTMGSSAVKEHGVRQRVHDKAEIL
jgi:hypothetical protein